MNHERIYFLIQLQIRIHFKRLIGFHQKWLRNTAPSHDSFGIAIDPPLDKASTKWAARKRPTIAPGDERKRSSGHARKRRSSSDSIPSILAGSDFEYYDDDDDDAVADDEGTDGTAGGGSPGFFSRNTVTLPPIDAHKGGFHI